MDSSACVIDPSSLVHPESVLAPNVQVGPFAIVERGAQIGQGTIIKSGAYIGENVQIGSECEIGQKCVILSNTVVGDRVKISPQAVLGTDGFGYVFDGKQHLKIPQLGNVIIGSDAEIGMGSCIDRAASGSTLIGQGAKIGNMVMIAHNSKVGDRTIIGDQSGFAGTTVIGNDCVVGSQCGMAMRSELGDRCQMKDRAGALRKFPADSLVSGFPARPDHEVKKMEAGIRAIPKLIKELSADNP